MVHPRSWKYAKENCPDGFIPVRQYAEKYGLTLSQVYNLTYTLKVKYVRVARFYFVEDAPPPQGTAGLEAHKDTKGWEFPARD